MHKAVQASQLSDQWISGTQIEVIGVGKHQANAKLVELAWGDRFDGPLSPYRGKDWSWDAAVGCTKNPGTGFSLPGF